MSVRLTKIVIQNFKNVMNGELSFVNHRKDYNASVLGLYGQNGSGKTALIDALELLKYALCALEIPDKFADFINVGAKSAEIEYSFEIDGKDTAIYCLTLTKNVSETGNAEEAVAGKCRPVLSREVFKCPIRASNGKYRTGKVIDTEGVGAFSPETKYKLLVGNGKNELIDLIAAKKVAQKTSRSFLFSTDLSHAINAKSEKKSDEVARYLRILKALTSYGNFELFVINTSNSGLISLNAQPFMFKMKEKGGSNIIAFLLEEPTVISEDLYSVAKSVIKNMNIVLEQIIPNLTIGIKNLGNQVMSDGKLGYRIDLVSRKSRKEIPLRYESEGIKKIVSVLQLLIVMFNQKSVTVAIDELDSGIFEYLLGELLRIISEQGKGQLIFTSHNLRPLETIDKGFVAFTTTNPEHRYTRLANVKENNNLRDFYYRDIMLGDEPVYDTTNNAEIAMAFRKAGEELG